MHVPQLPRLRALWPLLPLSALALHLLRGSTWHTRWLAGAPAPSADEAHVSFTRGRLRIYGFGLVGALAAFSALRDAILIALPKSAFEWMIGGGSSNLSHQSAPSAAIWSIGLHALLATLLLYGPLRIHRLLRGMRPKPGPRDGAAVAAPAILSTGLMAFAWWFGVRGLVVIIDTATASGAQGMSGVLSVWLLAAIYPVLCTLCARAALRGGSTRSPDGMLGLELGAIFVLLHLVPDVVREIVRQKGTPNYSIGLVSADTLALVLVAGGLSLAVLGWAQYRRSRDPIEFDHPAVEVFE